LNNKITNELWFNEEPIYFKGNFCDEIGITSETLNKKFYKRYKQNKTLSFLKEYENTEHFYIITKKGIEYLNNLLTSFEEKGIYPHQTAMFRDMIQIHEKDGDMILFLR
jgi:GR25 family glycosyltransferase involved in LPS biosynthesis